MMVTNREYLNALADIGDGSLTDWFDQEYVDIVRCRDCRYYYEGSDDFCTFDWCDYWNAGIVSFDGFCAWGERKVVGE